MAQCVSEVYLKFGKKYCAYSRESRDFGYAYECDWGLLEIMYQSNPLSVLVSFNSVVADSAVDRLG